MRDACPDANLLTRFVQGKILDESTLYALHGHLTVCESCVATLPHVDRFDDELLAMLRQGGDELHADEAGCHEAVRRVAHLGVDHLAIRSLSADTTFAWQRNDDTQAFTPIDRRRFLDELTRYGLVDVTRSVGLARFEPEGRESAATLAAALVEARELTPFQAAKLLRGDGSQLRLDSYIVLEQIGGGGMGVVVKARHDQLRRIVAVKWIRRGTSLNHAGCARFQREIETLAQLSHPNIVSAFDAGEKDGVPYLVMEFVDGKDLSTVLRELGPLPSATRLSASSRPLRDSRTHTGPGSSTAMSSHRT